MMEILFLLIGLGLGGGAVWFYASARTARLMARREAEWRQEAARQADARRADADTLRQEMRAIAAEFVAQQGSSLRRTHLEQLDTLLGPLEKDLAQFRRQFTETNASMRQQVDDLFRQTLSLGRQAEALTRAMTTDSKRQGDWGEAVLRNLLEASGLTEGRDFDVQYRVRTDEGEVQIPDVVVHLPEGRNVIVDSKVSLTAFVRYAAATDRAESDQLLKEHVRSVRQHVRELSQKDYGASVEGNIGYVLMFIPNEAAYLAAVSADAQLTTDAYRAHVIVLNPTNLFMALQLAYNLWQTQLREAGVKDIYHSAERLYKKFTLFAANFVKVGEQINRLGDTYELSRRQLCQGRGNIVSQLEQWRLRGLMPKDRIPRELTDEADLTDSDAS